MNQPFDFKEIQLQVKKQQRHRNLGLVCVITLIVLSVIFGAPRLVDSFFYNPKSGNQLSDVDSYIINRQINNELTTQNQSLSRYEINAEGYGKYAVTEIYRNLAQNQTNTKTYTINRNQLKETQLSIPEMTDYLFEQRFRNSSSDVFTESELHKELLLAKVKELPKSTDIIATVIFDEDLTLDELAEWQMYNLGQGEVLWTAVRSEVPTGNQDYQPLGFASVYSGVLPSERQIDQSYLEEFPFLTHGNATNAQEMNYSETEQQAAHFTSMLHFLQTQTDFLALEPAYDREIISSEQIADTLSYVGEHGVNTYGVSIRINVDQLIALLETGENVLAVNVTETTLFNLFR